MSRDSALHSSGITPPSGGCDIPANQQQRHFGFFDLNPASRIGVYVLTQKEETMNVEHLQKIALM
jgi:hypothetical protein